MLLCHTHYASLNSRTLAQVIAVTEKMNCNNINEPSEKEPSHCDNCTSTHVQMDTTATVVIGELNIMNFGFDEMKTD